MAALHSSKKADPDFLGHPDPVYSRYGSGENGTEIMFDLASVLRIEIWIQIRSK